MNPDVKYYFKTTIEISPVTVYEDVDLYHIHATLYAHSEARGSEGGEVATISGTHIPHARDPEVAIDLADSQSQDLYNKAFATLKARDPEVGSWVSLDHLKVREEWRGQKLGQRLVKDVVNYCRHQIHTLIVVHPEPIDSEWDEEDIEDASDMLKGYWSDLGFTPHEEGSPYYTYNTTYRWAAAS